MTTSSLAGKTKVLPRNTEAEQVVLGTILTDNAAFESVGDFLEPSHFFHDFHRDLFAMMRTAIQSQQTVALDTIPGQLGIPLDRIVFQERTLDQYRRDMVAMAAGLSSVSDYGEQIRDFATRREIIRLADVMAERAYHAPVDVTPRIQIEQIEQQLYLLAEPSKFGSGFQPFEVAVTAALDRAALVYQTGGNLSGLSTGLRDLDLKLGGLQSTDLIILAGRPGTGKSALATNIAFYVACAERVAGFFSLEMSGEQLATRIIAEQAAVPSSSIRRGDITEADFERMREAADLRQRIPLHIDETGGLSIAQLSARARRLKRQRGLDLLIVDYIQLMAGSGRKGQNRVNELTEITTGLKALAKDLQVPILALSQLSRQVENREDKRPTLSDLRESGSIEQDADVVLFLYREEYYLQNREPKDVGGEDHIKWQAAIDLAHGKADVIIAKQRHGPTGTVAMQFDASVTRFADLARPHEEVPYGL